MTSRRRGCARRRTPSRASSNRLPGTGRHLLTGCWPRAERRRSRTGIGGSAGPEGFAARTPFQAGVRRAARSEEPSPARSAGEPLPAQEAVVRHLVVVALAAQVDVRLGCESGRRIEGTRTDRDLRRSILAPKEARSALTAESPPYRGRGRIPPEPARLGESEPGSVDGRVGPDVAMPATALRAVTERDRAQLKMDLVPHGPARTPAGVHACRIARASAVIPTARPSTERPGRVAPGQAVPLGRRRERWSCARGESSAPRRSTGSSRSPSGSTGAGAGRSARGRDAGAPASPSSSRGGRDLGRPSGRGASSRPLWPWAPGPPARPRSRCGG